MNDKPQIVAWFSCGAASAVAAYETKRLYGHSYDIRIVNNPVAEEHPDNWRFMRDCEKWFEQPIELATNDLFPTFSAFEVWEKRRFMSGPRGAPCTIELKKEARRQWEETNQVDFMVFGFTVEEIKRHERFVLTERQNVLPVLIMLDLTKQDCLNRLVQAGIKPPAMYDLGYPNANCIGCVKATSPTYWNHVRKTHPQIFQQRAVQSRDIGAKLARYKGDRIYLDELPSDAKGAPLRSLKMPECGSFCEEWQPEPNENYDDD